jgi:GR25 family glycosyltransferase involved in LPS biosynthesis
MIKTLIINLKRAVPRRNAMIEKLKDTIITDFTFIKGVDCETDLQDYSFNIIPNWIDPIDKEPISIGYIGCTLSHYNCWKYIVDSKLEKALILEDDTIFHDTFNDGLKYILQFDSKLYDMCYLNRNKLNDLYNLGEEEKVNDKLVIPKYCYNASSYIMTYSGALKMLNTDCLDKFLPIDELLPIMYDELYPFKEYSKYYDPYPKLKALAFETDIADQEHRDDYPSYIVGTKLYENEMHMTQKEREIIILYKGNRIN